ncbi:MAG: phosphoenolpyruvate synthase, partial [Euryarchaeota archaeon]|nr:phosphoenolpyruvate synthase [Euryarchaeota archaeon]
MNIAWFEELGKDDVGLVGGKGANLGEMTKAKLPIPPGFVVTAAAYNQFLDETGIRDSINEILSGANVDKSSELQAASKKVRKVIEESEMPQSIKDDIMAGYRKLSEMSGVEEEFVAVRSSATAEDLPGASFAGQQETFLNIRGEDVVVERVRKCWSSLFTPRAIFYREKQGFEHSKVSIAVVVQKMINSDKAGVMFTIHPATGEKNKLIIEAGWGLGEGVVSGTVTPDHYVVDKETEEIISKDIMTKDLMFTKDPKTGKTIKVKIEDERRTGQVLTDEEILRVARLGKEVEAHYSFPQDIEWAVEGS